MKLTCELVQDLLPLYAEGMLQEGNRKLVREHLDSCAHCRGLLGELSSPEVHIEHHDSDLKSFRKKLRRHTFTVAAVTAFLVIFAALLIWSFFMSGSDALGYAFLAFYVILPLAALICSLLLGLRKSRAKWIVPFVFGIVAGVLPLIVFQYTESTFFVIPFVFSIVGTLIGHVAYLIKTMRKKKAAS